MMNKLFSKKFLFTCGFLLCLIPLLTKIKMLSDFNTRGPKARLLVIVPVSEVSVCKGISYSFVDQALVDALSGVFSSVSLSHPRYQSEELIQIEGYLRNLTFEPKISEILSSFSASQKPSSTTCVIEKPKIIKFSTLLPSINWRDFVNPILLLVGYVVITVLLFNNVFMKHASTLLSLLSLLAFLAGGYLLYSNKNYFYSVKLGGFSKEISKSIREAVIYEYMISSSPSLTYLRGETTSDGVDLLVRDDNEVPELIEKHTRNILEQTQFRSLPSIYKSIATVTIEIKPDVQFNKIFLFVKYVLLAICLLIFLSSLWLVKRKQSCPFSK